MKPEFLKQLKTIEQLHEGDCVAVEEKEIYGEKFYKQYPAIKSNKTYRFAPFGIVFFCHPADAKIIGYLQNN